MAFSGEGFIESAKIAFLLEPKHMTEITWFKSLASWLLTYVIVLIVICACVIYSTLLDLHGITSI
jgi:hypothetical protein